MSNNEEKVDLTSLDGFSLKPDWGKDTNYKSATTKSSSGNKKKDKSKRISKTKKYSYKKDEDFSKKEKFTVSVRPKTEVINLIKQKIRTTGISYSLKEICDTICEKVDRLTFHIEYVNVKDFLIVNKDTGKYYSNYQEAVEDLIYNHGKEYISTRVLSEYEITHPVNYVLKCPLTGKILPPPNIHNFEDIVHSHIFEKGITKKYSNYLESLIKIDDNEALEALKSETFKNFEYELVKNKDMVFDSIQKLKYSLITEFDNRRFAKKTKLMLKYDELQNFPVVIKRAIEKIMVNKRLWSKEVFLACLVLFRKSKFTLYKKNKETYISACKAKSLESIKLNKIAESIIEFVSGSTAAPLMIKEMISHDSFKAHSRKEILVELKWLVKEGYLREFSNSSISIP